MPLERLRPPCNSPPGDTAYDAAQRQFLLGYRDRLNIFCNTQRLNGDGVQHAEELTLSLVWTGSVTPRWWTLRQLRHTNCLLRLSDPVFSPRKPITGHCRI